MALTAGHSKAVVMLGLVYCLLLLPLFVFCVWFLLCYAVVYFLPSFTIISLGGERERELAVLLFMFSWCHVAVIVLCLFLMVPSVGAFCGILGHTHLLCDYRISWSNSLTF